MPRVPRGLVLQAEANRSQERSEGVDWEPSTQIAALMEFETPSSFAEARILGGKRLDGVSYSRRKPIEAKSGAKA